MENDRSLSDLCQHCTTHCLARLDDIYIQNIERKLCGKSRD